MRKVNKTHLNLEADYAKSTSEIFLNVALASIQCDNTLEVLSYAWRSMDYDDASPSWVPRWDLTDKTCSSPLATFLYSAAGISVSRYNINIDHYSLCAQGISIASVVATNIILRPGELHSVKSVEDTREALKSELSMLSRILVQDRTHVDTTHETSFMCASEQGSATHFADFAAFIIPLLEAHNQGCYVSLMSTWCNHCEAFMSQQRTAKLEPDERWYMCSLCEPGESGGREFELCRTCYVKGRRCLDSAHVLRTTTTPTFWCPYSKSVLEDLRSVADQGDGNRFFSVARLACRTQICFRLSNGMLGMGPASIDPGDSVVVLFGSRVPFILRRDENGYRLISDCYVHGIMDGEAYHNFENGKLREETFIIL